MSASERESARCDVATPSVPWWPSAAIRARTPRPDSKASHNASSCPQCRDELWVVDSIHNDGNLSGYYRFFQFTAVPDVQGNKR